MKSGLCFLLAARQCEIAELEQLARTSELVGLICRFTHALQRERGICNIYLASQGRQFAGQRHRQVADCQQAELEVRRYFDLLDTDAAPLRNGARLFSRIAVVLHGLDALGELRRRVAALALPPRECTEAFMRLIAGLLAVVFEAADSAPDPEISRALVALFNFMQGKEFAGQERALGAAAFAGAEKPGAVGPHWRHLVESQEACLQVFADFLDPQLLAGAGAAIDEIKVSPEMERLRRLDEAAAGPDLDLSQAWYDCCTRRIDAMKLVEDLLAAGLRRLCERKIAHARAELRDQQAVLEALSREARSAAPGAPAPYGPQLERSIVDMVQEQARRLQSMSDELDTVRAALNERKVIERAKGLLMAHRQLSEEEAYKTLRQMAMNQKRRLADVAEGVLAMAEVLPRRGD